MPEQDRPRTDCGERVEAERLPPIPVYFTQWPEWGLAATRALEREIRKRVSTAECRDRVEAEGAER